MRISRLPADCLCMECRSSLPRGSAPGTVRNNWPYPFFKESDRAARVAGGEWDHAWSWRSVPTSGNAMSRKIFRGDASRHLLLLEPGRQSRRARVPAGISLREQAAYPPGGRRSDRVVASRFAKVDLAKEARRGESPGVGEERRADG